MTTQSAEAIALFRYRVSAETLGPRLSPGDRPPPGIDYLGLVVAEHDDQLLGQIAYRDLPRTTTSQEQRS